MKRDGILRGGRPFLYVVSLFRCFCQGIPVIINYDSRRPKAPVLGLCCRALAALSPASR